jgi:hypothetical protein
MWGLSLAISQTSFFAYSAASVIWRMEDLPLQDAEGNVLLIQDWTPWAHLS